MRQLSIWLSCLLATAAQALQLPSSVTVVDSAGPGYCESSWYINLIADHLDNCTQVGNPDQTDTDGDGNVNFIDLGIMKQDFFSDYTTDNPSGVPNLCSGG